MVGDTVRTTCFREQLTQVCVGGGGRGRRACGRADGRPRLPPVPAVSLPPRPPPRVGDSRGPLSGAGTRTDGRRIYAAALADSRALDCTRRRRCCVQRGYLQQIYIVCYSSQVAAGPSRLRLHAAGYSLPPPLVPYERHVNVLLILTLLTVLPVVR